MIYMSDFLLFPSLRKNKREGIIEEERKVDIFLINKNLFVFMYHIVESRIVAVWFPLLKSTMGNREVS